MGLWLLGAFGGVGTTTALGLAGWARGLTDTTGLVTALPTFSTLDFNGPAQFVVGGHDIRESDFVTSAQEMHRRAGLFTPALIESCKTTLLDWSRNVCPGTLLSAGPTISSLSDWSAAQRRELPRQAIDRIKRDLADFRRREKLEQVVVVNVASTEAPTPLAELHESLALLGPALETASEPSPLPPSSLYALAALELGLVYVNFTPSLGASFPAALELAQQRAALVAGQDGKTGETLLKAVLAPMFARRHLEVLSWVGHNIFGNRDGLVLNDPQNKAAKVRAKDQLLAPILGYRPQTHVSIEYVPSLDDWKTAWDHIHFAGFLGTKMTMQFTWQGCDSILAAPLVIDLARLTLLAQRRGQTGICPALACFFKNPLGVQEFDFFQQWRLLEDWLGTLESR
ncbi:MAG TPA: inositol-3-phosphate synthase [Gemmatales bacterium]|nr:inositol-3-phosphate synthase [Gemmatales bacterium]HMP60045.1 inositol-3-phosphate synthase [Gemmatales bacterium]